MAIDWDTIRPVLLSLFSELGDDIQTVWVDKRRPYIDPAKQEVLLLRVRSSVGIGVEERAYTDLELDAPQATLEETNSGQRIVSLDVRVESFRHDDDRFAMNAIESIRSGLRFGSSHAILLAQYIALVRVGQALDLSGVVQDDRATSVAVLEVTLAISACAADTKNHVYNIETVDNPVDHANTVISS